MQKLKNEWIPSRSFHCAIQTKVPIIRQKCRLLSSQTEHPILVYNSSVKPAWADDVAAVMENHAARALKSEGSQLRAYAATAIFASCVNWLCNGVFMDQSSILCVLFLSVGSMVQTCVTSAWRTDRDQLGYPASVWPLANYMMIDSNQHPIWSEKIVWWRERRKGSYCFFFF